MSNFGDGGLKPIWWNFVVGRGVGTGEYVIREGELLEYGMSAMPFYEPQNYHFITFHSSNIFCIYL